MEFSAKFLLEKSAAERRKEATSPLCEKCGVRHLDDGISCPIIDIRYILDFSNNSVFHSQVFLGLRECILQLNVDPQLILFKKEFLLNFVEKTSMRSLLKMSLCKEVMSLYEQIVASPLIPVINSFSDLILISVFSKFIHSLLKYPRESLKKMLRKQSMEEDDAQYSPDISGIIIYHLFLAVMRQCHIHNNNLTDRINLFDWTDFVKTVKVKTPVFNMNLNKLEMPFHISTDTLMEFVHPYKHMPHLTLKEPGVLVITESGLSWVDSNWITYPVPIEVYLRRAEKKSSIAVHMAAKNICKNICSSSSGAVPEMYAVKMTKIEHDRVLKTMRAAFNKVVRDSNVKWIEDKRRISNSLILPRTQMQPPFGFRNWSQLTGRKQTRKSNIYARQIIADEFVNIMNSSQLGNESCFGEMIEYALDEIALFLNGRVYGSYKLAQDQDEKNYLVIEPSLPSANEPNEILDMDVLTNNSNVFYDNEGNHMLIPKEETVENTCSLSDDSEEEQENNTSLQDDNADFMILTPDNETGSLLSFENNYNDAQNSDSFLNGNIDSHSTSSALSDVPSDDISITESVTTQEEPSDYQLSFAYNIFNHDIYDQALRHHPELFPPIHLPICFIRSMDARGFREPKLERTVPFSPFFLTFPHCCLHLFCFHYNGLYKLYVGRSYLAIHKKKVVYIAKAPYYVARSFSLDDLSESDVESQSDDDGSESFESAGLPSPKSDEAETDAEDESYEDEAHENFLQPNEQLSNDSIKMLRVEMRNNMLIFKNLGFYEHIKLYLGDNQAAELRKGPLPYFLNENRCAEDDLNSWNGIYISRIMNNVHSSQLKFDSLRENGMIPQFLSDVSMHTQEVMCDSSGNILSETDSELSTLTLSRPSFRHTVSYHTKLTYNRLMIRPSTFGFRSTHDRNGNSLSFMGFPPTEPVELNQPSSQPFESQFVANQHILPPHSAQSIISGTSSEYNSPLQTDQAPMQPVPSDVEMRLIQNWNSLSFMGFPTIQLIHANLPYSHPFESQSVANQHILPPHSAESIISGTSSGYNPPVRADQAFMQPVPSDVEISINQNRNPQSIMGLSPIEPVELNLPSSQPFESQPVANQHILPPHSAESIISGTSSGYNPPVRADQAFMQPVPSDVEMRLNQNEYPLSFMSGAPIEPVDLNLPSSQRLESRSVANQHILPPRSAQNIISFTIPENNTSIWYDEADPSVLEIRLNVDGNIVSYTSYAPMEAEELNMPSSQPFESQPVPNQPITPHSTQNIISGTSLGYNPPVRADQAFMQPVPSDVEIRINQNRNPQLIMGSPPIQPVELNLPSSQPFESQPVATQHILPPHSTQNIISGTSSGYNPPVWADHAFMPPAPSNVGMRLNQNGNPLSIRGFSPLQLVDLNLPFSHPLESQTVANQHLLPPHSAESIISGTSLGYNPPVQADQAFIQPVPSDVEMRLNQNRNPLSFMSGAPIEPVDLNLPSAPQFESQSVANQHILPPHSAESIISGTSSEYNSPLQTAQASMQPVPSDVEMRLIQNWNSLSFMGFPTIQLIHANLPYSHPFESQSVANQHILPPHSAESIISGTSSGYNPPVRDDQAFMQPVPSDVEISINQNRNPQSIMGLSPIEPVELNLPSSQPFESQHVANQHILPPHSTQNIISGTSSRYNPPLQTDQASMQPVPSDVEMRLNQNEYPLSFMGGAPIEPVDLNLPSSQRFESQSVANQHILPPHSAESIISGTTSEYNSPLQTDQASMQPVPSDVEMRLNQNGNPLSIMSGAPIEPVDLNLPSAPQFESQSVANQHILPPHSAESIISGTSSEYNSPLQTDQAFMQPVPSDVEMRLNQNENPLSIMSGAPIEPVDLNLPSAPQFESQSVANQHILPPHSAESIISGTSSEYNSPLQTAQASMQPVPSDVEMRLIQNWNSLSFMGFPTIQLVPANLPYSHPFESQSVANQHILPPHSAQSIISGTSSEYNPPLQTDQASMQPVPSDVEMRLNQNENPLSFMSGAPIEPVDLNLPSAPQFESQSVANQHILPPHSAESIISGTSSEYNSPLQTDQAFMQPVPSDVEMRLNQNENPLSFMSGAPIEPVDLNLPSAPQFESQSVANQHILPPHSAESIISGTSSEYNSPLQTAQASMQPVPSDVEMRLNQNRNPQSFVAYPPIDPVELNLPSSQPFESEPVANQHILPPHSAESFISGRSSEYNSPLQTAQASMQPVPSDVEMRLNQNENPLSFMSGAPIEPVDLNLPSAPQFESQSVANQHILPPHSAESIISGTSSEYNSPLQTAQASMQPVPSDVEMRLNQNRNPQSFVAYPPIDPVELNLPSSQPFESEPVANQHILPPHSAESFISGRSSEYNSPLQTAQASMQPVPSDVEMRLNQNENPLSFMSGAPIEPVDLNLPSAPQFESQSVANQHILPPHSAESIISGTSSEYNSPLQTAQASMQPVPSDVEMRFIQNWNSLSFMGFPTIQLVPANLPYSHPFESQSVANQHILPPHSAQSIISGTSSEYNPPLQTDQASMQPVPSDVEMRLNQNENPLSFMSGAPIEPVDLNLPSAPQFESQSVANQHILPPHSAESIISGTSSEYNSPLQTDQAFMQPVPSDVEMRLNQNENPLSFMGFPPIDPVELNLPSSQPFESQSVANQHLLPPHSAESIISGTSSEYNSPLQIDQAFMQPVPSDVEMRLNQSENPLSFRGGAPIEPVDLNLPSSQRFESQSVANQNILLPHSAQSIISGTSSGYNPPVRADQAFMQPVPSDVEMRLNQNRNPQSFVAYPPIDPVELNLPSSQPFESEPVANQHILPPHSAESFISGRSSEYNSPLQTAQASMQPVPSDVEMRLNQNENPLSFMSGAPIEPVDLNLPSAPQFESQSVANQHILPPHSAESIISGTSSEYNSPLQTAQASMQPVPSDVEMRLNQNRNPQSFVAYPPIDPVELNLPSSQPFESEPVANQHILPPHSAESFISGRSSEYNSPLQTAQASMQPVPSDVEMRLNQNENPLSFMSGAPIEPVDLNLPSAPQFESQSVANQHILPPHSAESIISGTSSEYNSPLQTAQASMQPVPSDVEMRFIQNWNSLSFMGFPTIQLVPANLPYSHPFESQSVANQHILPPHSAQSIISGTSSEYNPPLQTDQASMQPVPSDVEMRLNQNENPLSFMSGAPIEPVDLNLPSAPQFESQSVANQHILPPHSAESIISGTSSEYNSPLQTDQAFMQPVPSDVEMRLNQNENPLSFMGFPPIDPVELNLPSSQPFESQSVANQHLLPPHSAESIISGTSSEYNSPLQIDQAFMQPVPSDVEMRLNQSENPLSFRGGAPIEPVDLNLPSSQRFESQSVANQNILLPHSAQSIISGTSSGYNPPVRADQAFMQPVPSDVEMRINPNGNPLSFIGFPPIEPVELNLPSAPQFESQSVANQHILPPHSAESFISGTSSEYNSPLQTAQASMQPVPSDVEMRLNQNENPLSFMGGAPIEPVDLNLPSSQRFESQSLANQHILPPHRVRLIMSDTISGYDTSLWVDEVDPSVFELRISRNGNLVSFMRYAPLRQGVQDSSSSTQLGTVHIEQTFSTQNIPYDRNTEYDDSPDEPLIQSKTFVRRVEYIQIMNQQATEGDSLALAEQNKIELNETPQSTAPTFQQDSVISFNMLSSSRQNNSDDQSDNGENVNQMLIDHESPESAQQPFESINHQLILNDQPTSPPVELVRSPVDGVNYDPVIDPQSQIPFMNPVEDVSQFSDSEITGTRKMSTSQQQQLPMNSSVSPRGSKRSPGQTDTIPAKKRCSEQFLQRNSPTESNNISSGRTNTENYEDIVYLFSQRSSDSPEEVIEISFPIDHSIIHHETFRAGLSLEKLEEFRKLQMMAILRASFTDTFVRFFTEILNTIGRIHVLPTNADSLQRACRIIKKVVETTKPCLLMDAYIQLPKKLKQLLDRTVVPPTLRDYSPVNPLEMTYKQRWLYYFQLPNATGTAPITTKMIAAYMSKVHIDTFKTSLPIHNPPLSVIFELINDHFDLLTVEFMNSDMSQEASEWLEQRQSEHRQFETNLWYIIGKNKQ